MLNVLSFGKGQFHTETLDNKSIKVFFLASQAYVYFIEYFREVNPDTCHRLYLYFLNISVIQNFILSISLRHTHPISFLDKSTGPIFS